jgi:hypothetical protein
MNSLEKLLKHSVVIGTVFAFISIITLIVMFCMGYFTVFYIMIAFIIGAGINLFIPQKVFWLWMTKDLFWTIIMIITMIIINMLFWFEIIPTIAQTDLNYNSDMAFFRGATRELIYAILFGFAYVFFMRWNDVLD